VARPDICSRF